MLVKLIEKEQKPLDQWSNKDFLLYFSDSLKGAGNGGLLIPPLAWRAYLSRIKGFRLKLRVSNQEYKCFIDTLFSKAFLKNKFVPVFGSIVSERVYNMYQKSPELSNEYFVAQRDELYNSNDFFKSL
ncbi:MAG: hypothetical protein M0R17_02065 [Candidatus Omnitrophica bacterium]|jgi:hypothetical protein|nr:hypothetical protein [Candidatus Omnitrophota bacterium]